jgi:hypothetical protein
VVVLSLLLRLLVRGATEVMLTDSGIEVGLRGGGSFVIGWTDPTLDLTVVMWQATTRAPEPVIVWRAVRWMAPTPVSLESATRLEAELSARGLIGKESTRTLGRTQHYRSVRFRSVALGGD